MCLPNRGLAPVHHRYALRRRQRREFRSRRAVVIVEATVLERFTEDAVAAGTAWTHLFRMHRNVCPVRMTGKSRVDAGQSEAQRRPAAADRHHRNQYPECRAKGKWRPAAGYEVLPYAFDQAGRDQQAWQGAENDRSRAPMLRLEEVGAESRTRMKGPSPRKIVEPDGSSFDHAERKAMTCQVPFKRCLTPR